MTYYMPMPYLPDDLKSIRYLFEYGMIAPHRMSHFEAFKKNYNESDFLFPMHRPPPMLIDLCSKDQCSVSNIPPLLLWPFTSLVACLFEWFF